MHNLYAMRVTCGLLISLSAASSLAQSTNMEVKPSSQAPLAAQAGMRASLPGDDGQDDEFAHRGFIATVKDPLIRAELKKMSLDKLEAEGLKISGDRAALLALQNAIEAPPPDYPIVTP
jgi:alkyl sulfatase BDS1-like metallo-beta-lactamase superfamily hydrolase